MSRRLNRSVNFDLMIKLKELNSNTGRTLLILSNWSGKLSFELTVCLEHNMIGVWQNTLGKYIRIMLTFELTEFD